MNLQVKPFCDEATSTFTYVVWDEISRDAIIIDPVWDFDPVNLVFSDESTDCLLSFISQHNLKVYYSLETHLHADHVSGSAQLKEQLDIGIGVSSAITKVQETFVNLLELPAEEVTPDLFDLLLENEQVVQAGTLSIRVIHTPGHTPACASFLIGDALFTGDALFMPDFGTGRCDFPNGSAAELFDSIQKLYTLPDSTRVFVGHDYRPGGRELRWETTIQDCKISNKHVTVGTSKQEFLEYRTQRDATLNLPKLLFQSVQINIRAGTLPNPTKSGNRMITIPILGE